MEPVGRFGILVPTEQGGSNKRAKAIVFARFLFSQSVEVAVHLHYL